MGDMHCDECGEQPYVALLTEDYKGYHDFDEVPDVEIWCECTTNRAIVFDGSSTFNSEEPENWGSSGSRYVCYECGETPVMRLHAVSGGTHPRIRYHLSCVCERVRVGFNWRQIHPDKWKGDMDPTKWESHRDEIIDVIAEHGPLTMDQIIERIEYDSDGIMCQIIHMHREKKIQSNRTDAGRVYMIPSMMMQQKSDEKNDDNYSDPDETGLRSAKGPAFFSRLLRWWENR